VKGRSLKDFPLLTRQVKGGMVSTDVSGELADAMILIGILVF
jgi:hypothetical protein